MHYIRNKLVKKKKQIRVLKTGRKGAILNWVIRLALIGKVLSRVFLFQIKQNSKTNTCLVCLRNSKVEEIGKRCQRGNRRSGHVHPADHCQKWSFSLTFSLSKRESHYRALGQRINVMITMPALKESRAEAQRPVSWRL